jgi:hypothetical protein
VVRGRVALCELLPEREAASTTAFEAESGAHPGLTGSRQRREWSGSRDGQATGRIWEWLV